MFILGAASRPIGRWLEFYAIRRQAAVEAIKRGDRKTLGELFAQ